METDSLSIAFVKDSVVIIREIVAIIVLLIGAYLGRKGLKKYLLNDLVTSKTSLINKRNEKICNYCHKKLDELESRFDSTPLDEEDVIYFSKIISELRDMSVNTSSKIKTLVFLLNRTVSEVPIIYERKEGFLTRISTSDYHFLITNVLYEIIDIGNSIIDIPYKIKLKYFSGIKSKYRVFFTNSGYYKLREYNLGVELNPKSDLALSFYEIVNRTASSSIFKRKYFQVLNDNYVIIAKMFFDGIYFPPILKNKTEYFLFGYEKLHLINYQVFDTDSADRGRYKTVKLWYSNLNRMVNFVDALKLNELENNFYDSYLNEPIKGEIIYRRSKEANETILLEFDIDDLRNYHSYNRFKLYWKLDNRFKKFFLNLKYPFNLLKEKLRL